MREFVYLSYNLIINSKAKLKQFDLFYNVNWI